MTIDSKPSQSSLMKSAGWTVPSLKSVSRRLICTRRRSPGPWPNSIVSQRFGRNGDFEFAVAIGEAERKIVLARVAVASERSDGLFEQIEPVDGEVIRMPPRTDAALHADINQHERTRQRAPLDQPSGHFARRVALEFHRGPRNHLKWWASLSNTPSTARSARRAEKDLSA